MDILGFFVEKREAGCAFLKRKPGQVTRDGESVSVFGKKRGGIAFLCLDEKKKEEGV